MFSILSRLTDIVIDHLRYSLYKGGDRDLQQRNVLNRFLLFFRKFTTPHDFLSLSHTHYMKHQIRSQTFVPVEVVRIKVETGFVQGIGERRSQNTSDFTLRVMLEGVSFIT